MPTTPQQSNTPSSVQSSATRRSSRLPRASVESDKASTGPANLGGVIMTSSASKEPEATAKNVDPSNPTPWRHPDELQYICREDWSQDLMLAYLVQNAFSVPGRGNTSIPHIQVTCRDGTLVSLPRAYRIPLMFVAKFQWESLRLVLDASHPSAEWQEYKFDIIHVSRLCHHLFEQARKAAPLEKMWRSKMFDRVLTRFYHKWLVNREWSVKNFYFEFDEEEYAIDVLKYDWTRWSLKGHKGFILTKDEIQNGITADQYMDGLAKDENGVWKMSPSAAPMNDSIEVKREHLQNLFPTVVKDGEPSLIDQFAGITNARLSPATSKKRPRDNASDSLPQSKKKKPQVVVGNGSSPQKNPRSPRSLQSTTSKSTLQERSNLKPSNSLSARAGPSSSANGTLPDRRGLTQKPLKPTTDDSFFSPTSLSSSPGKNKKRPLSSTAILASARQSTTAADMPVEADPAESQLRPTTQPENSAEQPKTSIGPLIPPISPLASSTTSEPILNTKDKPANASDSVSTATPKPTTSTPALAVPLLSPSVAQNSNQTPTLSKIVANGHVQEEGRASPLMAKITAVARQLMNATLKPPPMLQENGDVSSPQGKYVPQMNEHRSSPLIMASSSISENMISNQTQTPPGGQGTAPGEVLSGAEVGALSAEAGNLLEAGDLRNVKLTNGTNVSTTIPIVDTLASDATVPKEAVDTRGKEITTPISTPVADNPSTPARPPFARATTDAVVIATSLNAADAMSVDNAGGVVDNAPTDPTNSSEQRSLPPQPETVIPIPEFPTPVTMAKLIQSPSTSTLQQADSAAKATPEVPSGDKMDVDGDRPTNPPLTEEESPSVGQLVAQEETHGKTLHTVLLLRDLLRFLRHPFGEVEQGISTASTVASTGPKYLYPSVLESQAQYASLDGEEPLTVDQRLDVLAHASVALAKVLYPFRGEELENRIDSLDRRLQQQFEHLWKPLNEPSPEARILDEKEVQTLQMSLSSQAIQTNDELKAVEPIGTPPCTTSQGIQAVAAERSLMASGFQTEPILLASDPVPNPLQRESPIQLLSPDATMVDIFQPPTEGGALVDLSKPSSEEEKPERRPPVSSAVASIMRSIADLLESTSRDTSSRAVRSAKGKEREVDVRDVEMGSVEGYADSPILAALMNELKSMKDELRENQQRSREEIVAMRMLHHSEVDTLMGQMHDKEHQGREELEELRRLHGEELQKMRNTIHAMTSLKEKRESLEEGANVPALEILELSRRITTLESHSRADSCADFNSPAPQSSPTTVRDSEPPTTHRLPNSHPLAHLMPGEPDDSNSLPSPRTSRLVFPEQSASKPSTPTLSNRPSSLSRHSDGMDVEESIPLPIKTQRKMHMMMFQRPPG